MLRVTASAVVPASPAAVFELVSDTARYPEWVTNTDAVTRTDGPAREGSTYDEINPIVGPWKARTHWRVVEYEATLRQVHRSADVPLMSRFEIAIEVAPEGDASRLEVTLRAEPALGPIGAVFTRLMSARVERDHRRSVEAFAELASRELGAQQGRA
jgi:hypothetical protein